MVFNILAVVSFVLSALCTIVLSFFACAAFKLRADRARKLNDLKRSFGDFSQFGGFDD